MTVGLLCLLDLLVVRDSNYGGYASPVENPIQGNVMMIAETGDAQTSSGRCPVPVHRGMKPARNFPSKVEFSSFCI